MSLTLIPATTRAMRALSSIAFCLAAAACGGGDETVVAMTQAAARSTAQTPAPQSVTVQGCTVDRHFIPASGTPVRVLSADGRLLGNAQSDGQGRFALTLPAHSAVLLQVDRPDGESLPMQVDAQAPTWEKCLIDESA